LKAPVAMPIASFDARWPLDLKTWPSLEAQIAALSDDIAYVNHDIDDGLRAGLFTMADLAEAPLAGPQATDVQKRWPDLDPSRFIGELVRTLIGSLVDDLLAETRRRIADARPASADQVRHHPGALVSFSVAMDAQVRALKKFLFERMYRHPRVMRTMDQAKDVVAELSEAFSREPSLLPQDWAGRCGAAGDSVTGGVVRDYIAGMTDNFALSEYARIFHKEIALAAP
jgi:dGTPase